MRCAVCEAHAARRYREVDGVAYFRCDGCGSLFADPVFVAANRFAYSTDYWRAELDAARERCFGPAVLRAPQPDRIGFGHAFYPIRNPHFAGDNPIRLGLDRDFDLRRPPA